ncbi:MAG: helix-turn-helix transcriptional regulator [Patescibacteria group bacterium]
MVMPISTEQEPSRTVVLTARETEVLLTISQGVSSREAADILVCSKRTIDYHLANAYNKLKASNRIQALRKAARLGFIPIEAIN